MKKLTPLITALILAILTIAAFVIYRLHASITDKEPLSFSNLNQETSYIDPLKTKTDKSSTISASPWEGSISLYSSDNGLDFGFNGTLLFKNAAVPHILKTIDGDLIATFQYFYDKDTDEVIENGIMHYSISSDNGETWSDAEKLILEDLPEVCGCPTPDNPSMQSAVDPTLAQLEDASFRIYFTYHAVEDDYSMTSTAIADEIDEAFVYEGKIFENEDTYLLDPAVVYYDGLWHYYNSSNGYNDGTPEEYVNIHATSEDGQTFELEENINFSIGFLGGAVAMEDGIRFYGAGGVDGTLSAFSTDGYEWEEDNVPRYPGSDPGVVQLDDGSFLMLGQS